MNDQTPRPTWQTPDYSYGAQPGPYTPPAPAPQPKRRGKLKTLGIVLGVVLGLLLLIGVAGAIGNPDQTVKLPADVTTQAAPPATKTPAKPAAKKWVPLATLTGGTEKTSDTIRTTGGRLRITWQLTASDMRMAAIYLLNEGTDLQRDGGVPVVMVTGDDPNTDTIVLRKGAGEYFLQVAAANTKYKVTVEEER